MTQTVKENRRIKYNQTIGCFRMIRKLWCLSLIVICLEQTELAAGTDLITVTCTSNGNQCTVPNSECDNAANGAKCKCSAGYKLNSTNDGCLKVIGGACAIAADCTAPDPNANCTGDHSKTCTCKANYTEKKQLLGGCCVKEADCTATDLNANCTGSGQKTCTCKANYVVISNVCTRTDLTTVTCTRDGNQCTVLNSECDNAANGPKCKCSAGYKLNTSKDGCLKVIGGVCANAADCTATDPNANCTGDHAQTCTCKASYTEKNNVCILMVSSKACTGTTCPGTANAECANSKCKCSEGFTETADTCSKNAVLVFTCQND